MFLAARGDTALARIEAPAAPALELSSGQYDVRGAGSSPATLDGLAVFELASRAPVAVEAVPGGGARFRVPRNAIYVIDLDESAGAATVHRRSRFAISSRLLVVAAAAPLLTVPGLALLEAAALPGASRERVLDGRAVRLATLRRRVAALFLDLLAMGGLAVVLILLTPIFLAIAGLFPLAPLAYAWTANARGQSIGKWLAGVRVVDEGAAPPGPWRGLARTASGAAGWLVLGTGLLPAAIHPSRRALHDRFSGTLVIED